MLVFGTLMRMDWWWFGVQWGGEGREGGEDGEGQEGRMQLEIRGNGRGGGRGPLGRRGPGGRGPKGGRGLKGAGWTGLKKWATQATGRGLGQCTASPGGPKLLMGAHCGAAVRRGPAVNAMLCRACHAPPPPPNPSHPAPRSRTPRRWRSASSTTSSAGRTLSITPAGPRSSSEAMSR